MLTLSLLWSLFYHFISTNAISDVQSFGFKTSTGSTDGTSNNIIELTLWFNHTIYQCDIDSPSKDTTYSCSSSQYTIIDSFECNAFDNALLIHNPSSFHDSITLDNVFVTTKNSITYGINGICIPNTAFIGDRYDSQFLVTSNTDCSSGYNNFDKICIDDQTSDCYPDHQLLLFDISKPNEYISNALWNDGQSVTTDIITCDPTTKPTPAPTTLLPTVTPTNIPTKIPTNMPSKTPTNMPSSSPSSIPSMAPTTQSRTILPTVSPITNNPSLYPTVTPTFRPTKNPFDDTQLTAMEVGSTNKTISELTVFVSIEPEMQKLRDSEKHDVTHILIFIGVGIVIFAVLFCIYLVYRCKKLNDRFDELDVDNHYVQMNDNDKPNNEVLIRIKGNVTKRASTIDSYSDIVETINGTPMGMGNMNNVSLSSYNTDNDVVATLNATNYGQDEEFVIEENDGIITEGEEMHAIEHDEFIVEANNSDENDLVTAETNDENILTADGDMNYEEIEHETIVGDLVNDGNDNMVLDDNSETIQ
eukprot:243061_1